MMKSVLLGSALLGLAMLPAPAFADGTVNLGAALAGENETGGGAVGGTGAFSAELDPESGDLCFTLTVDGMGEPTAAHIHSGVAGKNGDPVVTISVTDEDGDECVAVQREVAAAIVAAPASYYVNVHSAAFPKGAVRGQLAPASGAAPVAAPAAAATPAAAVTEEPAAAGEEDQD